jgi:hypothetical protein
MSHPNPTVRQKIKERFSTLARTPTTGHQLPFGPASAKSLSYDSREIDSLPWSATESFAGVGNPLSLEKLEPGHAVLDLGCGARLDNILAARRLRPPVLSSAWI